MNLGKLIRLAPLALLASCAATPTPIQRPVAQPTDLQKQKAGSESNEVQLVSYTFDPKEGLPELPVDLATPEQGVYIVQLVRIAPAAEAEALRSELGLSLSEYLPNRAYREYLSDEQAQRVRRDPRVRALVGFPPAFKISATLLAASSSNPGQETPGFTVMVSRVANSASVRASLTDLAVGEVTLIETPGYPDRFVVANATAGAARAIANVAGTAWIEVVPSYDEDA